MSEPKTLTLADLENIWDRLGKIPDPHTPMPCSEFAWRCTYVPPASPFTAFRPSAALKWAVEYGGPVGGGMGS